QRGKRLRCRNADWQCKRRVRRKASNNASNRLVNLVSVTAAKHCPATVKHVPGKAYAGLEILVALRKRLRSRHQLAPKCSPRNEVHEPVLSFRRSHIPCIPQPEFKSKVWLELEAVHCIEIKRILHDAISNVADCSCRRIHL